MVAKVWYSGAYTVQTNIAPLNTGRQSPFIPPPGEISSIAWPSRLVLISLLQDGLITQPLVLQALSSSMERNVIGKPILMYNDGLPLLTFVQQNGLAR